MMPSFHALLTIQLYQYLQVGGCGRSFGPTGCVSIAAVLLEPTANMQRSTSTMIREPVNPTPSRLIALATAASNLPGRVVMGESPTPVLVG
jgi:hypothetical protein